MERLTETSAGGVQYIGKHAQMGADYPSTMRVAAVRDVMARLAAYEDTGLDPEQIHRPTCEGYDVEQLLQLSQLMRATGIQPQDLRPLCSNLTEAVSLAHAKIIKDLDDQYNRFMEMNGGKYAI